MKFQISSNLIKCPICDEPMKFSGHAAYYDRFSHYKTPVYHCKDCDIFYRHVDDAIRMNHYYAASYVQEKNEQQFFCARIKFFEYVLRLAGKYMKTNRGGLDSEFSLLDFGSSYGHLLELARDKGINAIGVEINERLMNSCRQRGLIVYKELSQVPGKVDAATLIDSLYYVPDCQKVLGNIKKCLKAGGVIVVRVTNRNLYAKLINKCVRKGDLSTLGDVIIGYSLKGMDRLLALTGFNLIEVIPDYGQGKDLGLSKRLCYLLSYVLTLLVRKKFILTPGLIVIARAAEPL